MNSVIAHIDSCQARLARHPFLTELRPGRTLEELLAFAPRLSTWVTAFQLVLKVTAQGARDESLRTMLSRHAEEECGHDTWFFEDVALLQGEHAGSRACDASDETERMALALLKEARSLPADALRLVFLLALESTSELFFGRVTPLVEATGAGDRLRYFGRHHQEQEEAHSVFEEEMHRRVKEVVLSDTTRAQAVALVDRTFAAFALLFDGLRSASLPPGMLHAEQLAVRA
jgi:hypothetical protein